MFVLSRIAVRNLTRNRRRTLFVVLAVAVGVSAVTGVRGFLNGLQGSLVSGFVEGTVGAIQIHRTGFLKNLEAAPLTPAITLDDALLARIEAVPNVRASAPRLTFPALLGVGDQSSFAMVTGIDPVREPRALTRRSESVAAGTFLTRESDILVGRELLSGLSGKLAGEVVLVGNDRDGVMNGVAGTVAGELAAFTQGEKKLVLLPLVKAQELVRMPGLATEIAVAVVDLALLDETAEALRLMLGPDYEVHTWRQVAAFATEVVDTQNAALDAIIVIFLIVILFGLANALLTSVFERVREIGTMMAVGTTRRQVLTLFVLESTLLGFFGGLVGVTAGALVVTLLGINGVHLTTPGASLPQLLVPVIGVPFLARMIVLSTVGAAFTALWPAWKASRLRPVEALASL